MPRYVAKENVVVACQFDGSASSAFECAKTIGQPLTITFNGDSPVLSIGTSPVDRGDFVVRNGPTVFPMSAGAIEEHYERIDGGECANPSPPPVPVAAMSVDEAFEHGRRLAKRGAIEEGDIVHDRRLADAKEPDLEFEVLEWNKETQAFTVDGPYGEVTIPFEHAVLVRKGE